MANKTIANIKEPIKLLRGASEHKLLTGTIETKSERFERYLRSWQQVTKPVTDATDMASIITAKDLSIMVY